MGTARSLRSLHDKYMQRSSSSYLASPPTKKENTLFTWSVRHEWQKRVGAWDEEQIRLRDIEIAEKRMEQRGQRQMITVALNGMLVKVMNAENKEDLKSSELNSLANAAAKILDQSRQEFNDLPTQRTDPLVNVSLNVNKGYISVNPDDWDGDDADGAT
jgi:hypothetical protein